MNMTLTRDDLPVSRDECPCYKCAGSELATDYRGREYVANNMEYHTFGEPCDDCETPRTKYRDLGRKGRYVCPVCQ